MNPKGDDFTQRRGRGEKCRVWTYDRDPRVSIRERINSSGGVGYRVTLPKGITGGPVLHLQSRDFEDAKNIARGRLRDFQQSRVTALELGEAQKIQAAAAIRRIREAANTENAPALNAPLDEVARQYVAGSRALRPHGLALDRGAEMLAEVLALAAGTKKPLLELVAFAVQRLSPAGGTKTLAAVIDEMASMKRTWKERGDLREASLRDFLNRTGRIAADIGEYELPALTKAVILGWLGGLGLTPRSVKNYRMILTEVLNYAQQKRYLTDNPMAELTRQDVKELGRGAETQPAILSPLEAERLLRAAYNEPKADLGPAIVLGLFAGIRTEELKRLKWDAVRLLDADPFVVIGADIAKKRRIRNVPLPPNAVAWLQRWPGDKTGAITRNAHANDFQKRFQRLAKAAGIEWKNNMMRHSFGSYDFALHGNSIETARKLGHRQDDTVLFSHYRALATKERGAGFFGIMPAAAGGIVAFPKLAG